MFFIFIIGTRFLTWGGQDANQYIRCPQCGTVGQFVNKKGMNFITLFFIIPVLPLSGVKHILQCRQCGARFNAGQV